MQPVVPSVVKPRKQLGVAKVRASKNPALRSLVERACDILIAIEPELNALDAKVGDGDTGSTIASACRDLKAKLPQLPLADLGAFFEALSNRLTKCMGGSSGVLLAIFFAAAGLAAATGKPWQLALQAGLRRMMEYGGAKPGDRTLIDALQPALATLSAGGSLAEAAKAARTGADATAQMTRARAGRASYLSADSLKGFPDPGAEAVARLMVGLASQA
jgi:dihydroxyacetone kinase